MTPKPTTSSGLPRCLEQWELPRHPWRAEQQCGNRATHDGETKCEKHCARAKELDPRAAVLRRGDRAVLRRALDALGEEGPDAAAARKLLGDE